MESSLKYGVLVTIISQQNKIAQDKIGDISFQFCLLGDKMIGMNNLVANEPSAELDKKFLFNKVSWKFC